METLTITSLLAKYQHQKPKDFGEFQERQYPVSAVIEMIREVKNENASFEFAKWLSDGEWIRRDKTHPNKVGQYYSHKHCEYKTLNELFYIFILL